MLNSHLHRTLAVGVLLAAPLVSQAATWQIDPNHSAAQFSVRHMMISTVRGQFQKMTGTAEFDPANPAKSGIDVTIDAASVDTRQEMRDKDLKSPNFFDVEKYPTLTFKSKRVVAAGPGKLKLTGDLTIHGTTKEVTFDVDGPTAPIKDQRGTQHVGASATTTISRKDFGMLYNKALETGGVLVGDEVNLTIDVEMTSKP
ncbi:MAG TPA: YceI family protein [Bryobacteraceae bacterium]|nr:YceI family protein [Bryobacteraceae bacterium]